MAKENKKAAAAATEKKSEQTAQVANPTTGDILDQIKAKNIVTDDAAIKGMAKMKEEEDNKKVQDFIRGYQKCEYINAKVLLSLKKRRSEADASKKLLDKTLAIILLLGNKLEGSFTLTSGFVVEDCAAVIKKAGFEAKQITPREADKLIAESLRDNAKDFSEVEKNMQEWLKELRDACDGRWKLDWDTNMQLDRLYGCD